MSPTTRSEGIICAVIETPARSTKRRCLSSIIKSTHEYCVQDDILTQVKATVPLDWESESVRSLSRRFAFHKDTIVYKLEERGSRSLVVNCPPAENSDTSGFINELTVDIRMPFVVENGDLGQPLDVFEWADLHHTADNVGGKYFFRTILTSSGKQTISRRASCQAKSCQDTTLSANMAYLVCICCDSAFHATCLSDKPLQFERRSSKVRDLAGSIKCLSCKRSIGYRGTREVQTLPSLLVLVDIGATRIRACGILEGGEPKYLPDSEETVKPVCFVDTSTRKVYFERRHQEKHLIEIGTLKNVILEAPSTVQASKIANVELNTIMRKFFRRLLDSLHLEFQHTIPDLHKVSITYACAAPAGLAHSQRNILLNAMLAARKHVTPVVLDEAKLSFMGCSTRPRAFDSPGLYKVLSVDIGGYTTDMMLAMVDTEKSNAAWPEAEILASTCHGLDASIDHVCNYIFGHPENNDPQALVRLKLQQFRRDIIHGRKPSLLYDNLIDFGFEWSRIRALQAGETLKTLQALIYKECDIKFLVISGGGARDKKIIERLRQTTTQHLCQEAEQVIELTPSSDKSTVLQGGIEALRYPRWEQHPMTILLESFSIENKAEFTVIQAKGEAIERAVLPASRSLNTLLYEVHYDDGPSKHELLATTEDLNFTVSSAGIQVVRPSKSIPMQRWRKDQKIAMIGHIVLDLKWPKKSNYLAEAVRIEVRQDYQTIKVEAILLAARRGTSTAPDLQDWGICETMTLKDIRNKSRQVDSLFKVKSKMPPRVFSLDLAVLGQKRAIITA